MAISISDNDKKTLDDIKKNIGQVFGNDVKSNNSSAPEKNAQEEQVSNALIKQVQKDFTKLDENLNEIDARKELPGQEKKLSPEKLKEYYKRAHKHFEQVKDIVDQSLENDKTINPNEQDQLKALVKTLDLTMQKLNKKMQAEQQQIEKELDKIRQIEEHEKKKEKGFLGKAVEQMDKAMDALAAILLPPDWYLKSKENESEIENTKLKDKPSRKEVSSEKNESKSQKLDSKIDLNSLGSLTPSAVPNLGQSKSQDVSR